MIKSWKDLSWFWFNLSTGANWNDVSTLYTIFSSRNKIICKELFVPFAVHSIAQSVCFYHFLFCDMTVGNQLDWEKENLRVFLIVKLRRSKALDEAHLCNSVLVDFRHTRVPPFSHQWFSERVALKWWVVILQIFSLLFFKSYSRTWLACLPNSPGLLRAITTILIVKLLKMIMLTVIVSHFLLYNAAWYKQRFFVVD